jgi:hypothetical protein
MKNKNLKSQQRKITDPDMNRAAAEQPLYVYLMKNQRTRNTNRQKRSR